MNAAVSKPKVQVQPQDATFLYLEGENCHTHVLMAWIYEPVSGPDSAPSIEDIRRHVASRLHVSHMLTQKLVRVPLDVDYPWWVDEDRLDLDYHVRESEAPAPGDWAAFRKVVSAIHSEPLDLKKPLWEIHVVRGLNFNALKKGAFAVVIKLHHVAVDGETGMAIIRGFHDLDPTPIPPESKQAAPTTLKHHGRKAPNSLQMVAAAVLNNLNYSIKGLGALAELASRLPNLLSRVRLQDMLNGKQAPDCLFHQDVSRERVVDSRFFDLERFKNIRPAVPGATINDVLLAVCGGALRRFLESKDDLPEDSLVVVCPINVRTRDEADQGGNRIAMMTTAIHSNIADPLERLQAVYASTQQSKSVIESIGAREIQELNNSLPSVLQSLAIAAVNHVPGMPKMPRKFNCSISNVPGPREPLYLGEARMVNMAVGMPVANGYGLFIGFCTYNGQVTLNVTSAWNILPEPDQLMVQFEHALAELEKAAGVGQKSPQSRKRSGAGATGG